ncbi:MAG TPA: hypothetical protein VE046_08545 [Steroidobacteraceae bacterium]|nr:hypothetical protein [Steroidobacteraceae bacterium]
MHFFIESAGWLGAALILIAYGLLSSGRLDGRSRLYQGMNVIGSIGFVINSGYNGAIPSAALNVIWMIIGLVALYRYRSRAIAGDGESRRS